MCLAKYKDAREYAIFSPRSYMSLVKRCSAKTKKEQSGYWLAIYNPHLFKRKFAGNVNIDCGYVRNRNKIISYTSSRAYGLTVPFLLATPLNDIYILSALGFHKTKTCSTTLLLIGYSQQGCSLIQRLEVTPEICRKIDQTSNLRCGSLRKRPSTLIA